MLAENVVMHRRGKGVKIGRTSTGIESVAGEKRVIKVRRG